MVHDYCILFPYHRNDDTTRLHYELIRYYNPDAPIIPIVDGTDAYLPNTVDVRDVLGPWDTSNKWAAMDTFLYRWYLRRDREARRYIAFEWDTFCLTSARHFFRDVWDAAVASAYVALIERDPEWHWFHHGGRERLPQAMWPAAAGIWTACSFFSAAALEVLVHKSIITPPDLFCELRVGTTARWNGIPLTEIPGARQTISWRPELIRGPERSIFHPVKGRP